VVQDICKISEVEGRIIEEVTTGVWRVEEDLVMIAEEDLLGEVHLHLTEELNVHSTLQGMMGSLSLVKLVVHTDMSLRIVKVLVKI
jgi:hypothetical protein